MNIAPIWYIVGFIIILLFARHCDKSRKQRDETNKKLDEIIKSRRRG